MSVPAAQQFSSLGLRETEYCGNATFYLVLGRCPDNVEENATIAAVVPVTGIVPVTEDDVLVAETSCFHQVGQANPAVVAASTLARLHDTRLLAALVRLPHIRQTFDGGPLSQLTLVDLPCVMQSSPTTGDRWVDRLVHVFLVAYNPAERLVADVEDVIGAVNVDETQIVDRVMVTDQPSISARPLHDPLAVRNDTGLFDGSARPLVPFVVEEAFQLPASDVRPSLGGVRHLNHLLVRYIVCSHEAIATSQSRHITRRGQGKIALSTPHTYDYIKVLISL